MATEHKLEPTENEYQRLIIDAAQLYGWLVAHFRPARTERGWRTAVEADGKGYPDLTLVRRRELIFIEVKAKRGKPTADQQRWLDALSQVAETWLATPDVWDELHERLKPRARGRGAGLHGVKRA
jgi:hypothetical protein